MKDSIFWRIIGIGTVLGLLWIGYSLGKNSQIPSPSFSSAVYADDVKPTKSEAEKSTDVKPVSKKPKLVFDFFANPQGLLGFERAKVPGGWLVIASDLNHRDAVEGFTFYPDPEHKWDGGSTE